jgi:uncharacterized protein YegJ (DUF2314 family)
MFFDEPMILHSTTDDGRHWLTSMDLPPLQILPVEGNQCRVAHSLALLLSAKLSDEEAQEGLDLPCELTLTRKDLEEAPALEDRFRPDRVREEGVRIHLELWAAPEGEEGDANDGGDEEDEAMFITPVPPPDWAGGYDQWLFETTAALGMEPPPPLPASSYEAAFSAAVARARQRLPELRAHFLEGMDGLNLGLKTGLATDSGGIEYVWVRPVAWPAPDTLTCVLESEPEDCAAYQLGQQLTLRADDIADYAIGSEDAGLVDPGYTQRIAEDYGLILP